MIEVSDLTKKFQDRHSKFILAVNKVSFSVSQGTFFTLLGPSGCGKTTTLRCIAGLERLDSGEVIINNIVLSSAEKGVFVSPHRRNIGMVFQSYAIWPHMNVFDNVAFPLIVSKKRLRRTIIKKRVDKVLNIVQLTGLENRPAPLLSGGQQQRLAFARALVREPQVLLLDEPLSNLDAKLREQMRIELKDLQQRLGITTIYVTHDQAEAMAMSDIVAVMKNGKIVQMGDPKEIYRQPLSKFVASFIGSTNFISGTVMKKPIISQTCQISTPIGLLHCFVPQGIRQGDDVLVSIRPEHVNLYVERPRFLYNVLQGIIQKTMFLGEFTDLRILVEKQVIGARLHPSIDLEIWKTVYVHLIPELCAVIPLD